MHIPYHLRLCLKNMNIKVFSLMRLYQFNTPNNDGPIHSSTFKRLFQPSMN